MNMYHMEEIDEDKIGRCFCKKHHRVRCHECCMDFEYPNRLAEEEAGLVKKRSEVEILAEDFVQGMYALKRMEEQTPRPNEECFAESRKWHKVTEAKLQKLKVQGEDVNTAVKKAVEVEEYREMERIAVMKAWSRQNPGKNEFVFGGAESQKLFEKFAATPNREGSSRVDLRTCSYCHKISKEELGFCPRCKKCCYCNHKCQKQAWKAHKKVCNKPNGRDEKVKPARLTWGQLEAFLGEPAIGQTLEVRAILDESNIRQVMQCKDHNGVMKTVSAYTHSRIIPGLKLGSVLKWKNPRCHLYVDGSTGACIGESDLVNVSIK